jgi:hypothetical protein
MSPSRSSTSPEVLFPQQYKWFIVLATLDVTLTWAVLQMGGREANPFAEYILVRWGMPGLIGLKFAVVGLVVCTCELIGRKRFFTAQRLAEWAVALNSIPVILGVVQIYAAIAGE